MKEKYTVCCKPKFCPELYIDYDSNEVVIVDDFGGRAKMTIEQAHVLKDLLIDHLKPNTIKEGSK